MIDKNSVLKIVEKVIKNYPVKPIIIAGNWKMNMTILEGKNFLKGLGSVSSVNKVILFIPYTAIASLSGEMTEKGIYYGSQNVHEDDHGAFTGEISIPMVQELGCNYVLLGHSERRTYYNETDQAVNKKVRAAVKNGLKAMICIGESLEQRQGGEWRNVLANQIKADLQGVTRNMYPFISIAYEPMWAIGTGVSATTKEISETHTYLKKVLQETLGVTIPVLYGGSVNDRNASEIGKIEDVDGFLIGGASLKANLFSSIIEQSNYKYNTEKK